MAQKRTLRQPTGSAGLVRYDEKEKSLIELQPMHVIAIIAGLLVLEIMLMFIPI